MRNVRQLQHRARLVSPTKQNGGCEGEVWRMHGRMTRFGDKQCLTFHSGRSPMLSRKIEASQHWLLIDVGCRRDQPSECAESFETRLSPRQTSKEFGADNTIALHCKTSFSPTENYTVTGAHQSMRNKYTLSSHVGSHVINTINRTNTHSIEMYINPMQLQETRHKYGWLFDTCRESGEVDNNYYR